MTEENQNPDDDVRLGVDPDHPDERPLVSAQKIHDAVSRMHYLAQVAAAVGVASYAQTIGDEDTMAEVSAYFSGYVDALELAHEIAHGGSVEEFFDRQVQQVAKASGATDEELEAELQAVDLVFDAVVTSARKQADARKSVESVFEEDEDMQSLAKQFESGDTSDEEDGN